MMQQIGDKMASFFVKALLFLLILSFGVWGIADMVLDRGGSGATVATVGDLEISQYEFRDRLTKSFQGFRNLEELFGKQMAFPRQALTENVLQAMINEAAMQLFVRDLNLGVHQDVIKDEVRKLSIFQDEKGEFSLDKYTEYMKRAPYMEQQLIGSVTAGLLEKQAQSIFAAEIMPPKKVVDMLAEKSAERRSLDYVFVENNPKTQKDPGDEKLKAFYENYENDFLTKEKRHVTYITISKAALKKDMSLSDKELKEIYMARDDLFGTPEKRVLTQFIANNKDTALKLYGALAEGKSVKNAEEMFKIKSSNLGAMTKKDLDGEVAKAVFALKKGDVTLPIKTPFGFHVLKVEKIQKKVKKPFNTVKKEVRKTVMQELLVESVIDLTNTVDEAINLGDDLETVAAQYGLDIKQNIALEDGMKTPKALNDELMKNAFLSEQGEIIPLTEKANGDYVAVRIDQIIPPMPKPFKQVRKAVLKRYKMEKVDELNRAKAASLLEDLKSGKKNLIQTGLRPQKTAMIKSNVAHKMFTDGQLQQIFSLTKEAPYAMLDAMKKGNGYFLVKLDKVKSQKVKKADLDAVTKSLQSDYKNAARQSLLTELRALYGVKTYPKVIGNIAENL